MTEKPEIVESSNGVILDPLSVYDFTDDALLNLSSERRVVEISPDCGAESSIDRKKKPHNATESPDNAIPNKSVGQISTTRRITRSQTPHNGAAEPTVKKSLNYPRAVRGKLVGKHVKRRKLVNAAAKNKSKSVQIREVIGSKKRKLEGQAPSSSSNLKTWDFYIPPNKHFHTRISSHTNCEVVKLLKSKLDDRQLQIFRGTAFGYFLDLPTVVVQNQLVHSLLLRQVVPKKEDELWFKVNGTKLRFGLAELGIITGLKCCGDADKGYESSSTNNRLMDMYFSGLEKVPKQSLIDCFLEKRWRSDEDAVKIAVLYFIHTFLFSTGSRAFITKADFDIVESGEYETFPWGILVFRAMVETMNNRLWTGLKMYRLGGLPLAIQCWFYECCTYVDGKWAHRIENKVPRILNWKIRRQPTLNELSSGIFKMSGHKLKLKNVSPTEFEQIHLDLPESSGIPNDKEVDSSELPEFHPSDDDFSTPPPKRSKNRPKTKSDPPVNNLEMSDEIQRLSDGQSELKSDIQKVLKATESLKEQMMASFADVFKAIESLSKKQPEKDDSEIDGRDGHHDRHGDGDSGGFNANDDHGSDGPDHGKDSIGDKENTEEGNVEAMDG
ncbi:PREDICTED: uncharacterized protein LOC109242805 [Nicotiana attenuata]|uniref:DUF1985 domain-containing protein n=1 Tax=Nicotiana attenuata TaxID=49451 RepID=A0A314L2K1_NICAT|nr:PREDICTED: uncharacterized protein LOC109242805 [Nicotiana attenuata]OIT35866.1 hypothetical protein A4A49_28641 [Nicotiana attenuata]